MDDILRDKRFAHVAKDPRFRKMPVGERKVKIDKRFKGMFKDKRFKLKYSVDKRGKPVNLTTNENLKKYYELSDKDSSDSDGNEDDKVERHSTDSSETEKVVKHENNLKGTIKKKKKNFNKADSRSQKKTSLNKPLQDKLGFNETDDTSESDSNSETDTNRKGKKNKVSYSTDSRFQSKLLNTNIKTVKARKEGKDLILNSDKPNIDNESDEEKFEVDNDSDENASDAEDSDYEEKKPFGNDSGVDFARGEGNIYSSSSDDDDDDDDESGSNSDDSDGQDVSKFDHKWGEVDDNVISLEEATLRLAVCNMDWDRMKAKDIYVLLNSFKPSDGIIKSVKVYPSEFGKERMAEELKHGPRELKELKLDSDEEEEDLVNEEGTTYHREKLREYQLNRLKYYYAVVECDTVETADHIYKECDGMEYESSATKLDLRFVPEEETFDEGDVSSVCTEVPANYKPQFFFNAALSQSKVDLTWDETDRERVQLTSQQFSNKAEEVEEEDLKAYLASSSDEEGPDYSAIFGNNEEDEDSGGESDDDKKLDKYKQLLTDLDSQESKKKHDIEMEISWEPGLREATEKIVKKKKQSKDSTVWEDYLQKKKEKKKKKIEERKKKKKPQEQMSDDEQKKEEPVDGDVQAFSDDEVPVDADMAAFMAEESSNKKKKNKKKKKKKVETEENTETAKEKAELSLLLMDEGDNKKHFNLRDLVQEDGKKKKKKKLKEQKNKLEEDDFQMNVRDPRFSAMYESHLFNIDPSAPEYRKTQGTEAIITEKIKRSGKRDKNKVSLSSQENEQVKKPKLMDKQTIKDDNLASLIKSVKSKTKHFHSNKAKR
ncbi:ESF1 homolog [Mercenaria mercenaria]|uniref:ESF1 homolog n=1 Tax=Mercenaria mercenaria TaxID=6596 RepID=UPI00234F2F43|nr:ESF1 homolog [Mercenaria mercenaria]